LSWPTLRLAIWRLRKGLSARGILSAAITAAIAGMPPPASAQTTRGETYAITRAQGPIVIDGDLNDEGWHDAIRIDRWYEIIGNPTMADAILDRLVHNAYRIELKGESLRKQKQSAPDQSVT